MTQHHWIIMSEDGTLPATTLVDESVECPLVAPYTLKVTFDRDSFCRLTPAQAAQLVTSLQEDYEAKV